MIEATGNTTTVGRPYRQVPDIEQATGAIAVFGRLVDDLVKRRKNVVSELNLSDRHMPLGSQTVSKADNPLFHQRRIEAASTAIFFLQMAGGAENTAKDTHILAKTNCFVIAGHGQVERIIDRLQQVHLSHASALPRFSDKHPDTCGYGPSACSTARPAAVELRRTRQ